MMKLFLGFTFLLFLFGCDGTKVSFTESPSIENPFAPEGPVVRLLKPPKNHIEGDDNEAHFEVLAGIMRWTVWSAMLMIKN